MIDCVSEWIPIDRLAVHCHDTYGMAIANILVSLERGIRVVDSSIAGLGGCPYALGGFRLLMIASGNVSTEDVVYLLHGLGYQTGIDLDRLVSIGVWISKLLDRPNMSKAGVALHGKSLKSSL
jgi:hydroxymethylglutaryl-CoA lyase